MSGNIIKSPLNWYGGKFYMAKKLIEMFPEHKYYIEGFGGAGHIIMRKQPSEIDVYNDINSDLYIFFKVLRSDRRDELISKIQLTPYSRQEFLECRDKKTECIDDVEKARIFYIKTMQSFSSIGTSWSYSKNKSRRGMSQAVSKFLGNVDDNMLSCIERLREVQVENLDIIDLIEKYDNKDAFFYLDPPYISETRISGDVYDKEMPIEKHEEMLKILLNIEGKCLISGYDHDVYDILTENHWAKTALGKYKHRNGDSKGKKRNTKQEIVWKNY